MKKLLFALLAVFALSLSVLFGCATPNDQNGENNLPNYEICVLFTADSDQTSVYDFMQALQTAGKLTYTGSNGAYGYYLESVYGISGSTTESTADSWSGYSWYVYTTLLTKDGVIYADDGNTVTYNGVTLYQSMYGVSGLPCVAGESYAFVYQYSTMTF